MLLITLLAALAQVPPTEVGGAVGSTEPPVLVVILAGQSNMEGKATVELMERQATSPADAERFARFRSEDRWASRDDVWIQFGERRGPLTVGYGSPKRIGPELAFGFAMGDATDRPVVLVKTAWGGKSLYRDFRPPSAGHPSDDVIAGILEREKKRVPERTEDEVRSSFGAYYGRMLGEVAAATADLGKLAPELRGREIELGGFVWFQGWNDMLDPVATGEYASNLGHLIRDVRRDLGAPGLPVVIGQFGVGGTKPTHAKHQRFKDAQAAGSALPEFRGNVALVKTDAFWDLRAQAVFDKGWKEHRDEWNRVGSDRPYHYLGSPRTYCDIGDAFAQSLLGLRASAAAK